MNRVYFTKVTGKKIATLATLLAAALLAACTPETTADDPRVDGLIVRAMPEPDLSILQDQHKLGTGKTTPSPTPAATPTTPESAPATMPMTSPATGPESAPSTVPATTDAPAAPAPPA